MLWGIRMLLVTLNLEARIMNVKDALKKIEEKQITSSIYMLRRWIRQGKIAAEIHSKNKVILPTRSY
jgi:predicted site-specific integrase-resolvase